MKLSDLAAGQTIRYLRTGNRARSTIEVLADGRHAGTTETSLGSWRVFEIRAAGRVASTFRVIFARELVDALLVRPAGELSPGFEAILEWSGSIHGYDGDRHEWALETARALDAGETEFPEFPSRYASTRADRASTAARIYAEAGIRYTDGRLS